MSNADEIVERLLNASVLMCEENFNLMHEAAALIEQQRDEIARLTAALKPFADAVYNDNGDVTITTSDIDVHCYLKARAAYRAALEETTTGETNGPLLRD